MKRFHCRWLLLLTLAFLLAGWRAPARAGSYTYNSSSSQRTVNAGVLVLSDAERGATGYGTGAQDNPDPYVFYVLSKRADALPPGWSVVNPLAPKTVSSDILLRWDYRDLNTPFPVPALLRVADAVTPSMAPYWEVVLPLATSDDLAQYDVLLLDVKGSRLTLTAADSEKLRRFVDGGGTLWVESGNGGVLGDATGKNGLFLNGLTFQGDALGPSPSYTNGQLASSPTVHTILTTPYFFQNTDLDALVDYGPTTLDTSLSFSAPVGAEVPLASDVLLSALRVVNTNNQTIVAAGSYGAGAIVVSTTLTAKIINYDSAGSGFQSKSEYGAGNAVRAASSLQPTGAVAAPMTVALKFLANIVAWSGGHGGEHQSSHQNGSAFNAFASPVRLWNDTRQSVLSSATIYGSMAFATDSAGVVHAYDINPAGSLTYPYGGAPPANPFDDFVKPTDLDYSKGASYDQVWAVATSPLASAPTATVDSTGKVVLLVEYPDGKIVELDAKTGALTPVYPSPGAGSFTGTAPAPVVYDGTVYANELVTSSSGNPPLNCAIIAINLKTGIATGPYVPSSSATLPTGAVAVGIVPVDTSVSGLALPTNDIMAFVPTQSYLYSVLLGSRGEKLSVTVAPTYRTLKLQGQGAVDSASGTYSVYTLDVNGLKDTTTITGTPITSTNTFKVIGTPPMVGTPPVVADIYADYSTDLDPTVSHTDVTRTRVGISSLNLTTATPPVMGVTSTPALDRFGNVCYVTNEGGRSSLVSFHDSPTPTNARLNWRFRLPILGSESGVIDADGQNYSAALTGSPVPNPGDLTGFQFVNAAPVVDERGNVYALATGNGKVAVICINGLQPVTTNPASHGTTLIQPLTTLLSNVPTAGAVDEFGDPVVQIPIAQYAQEDGGNNGLTPITLLNFGANRGGGATRSLYPNLSEPQSIYSQPNQNSTAGSTPLEVKLHTNVLWYTILPDKAAATATSQIYVDGTNASGLTKAGSSLFFVDGRGHLISVITDPTAAGIPIVGKYVNSIPAASSLPPVFTDYGDAGVGSGAVPSIANGALLVSGPQGIAGYANRVTVVADSSRIMELNSSGDATWLVDSTTGAPPNTALAQAGIATTSSLELNRPSSITELTANDYLVADTGNNRCVRFSRTGQTIWELSRLNDSIDLTGNDPVLQQQFGKKAPLLPSGEPDTLNQPTSVQIHTDLPVTVGGNVYTVVHYLVSDTGNYRILDIVDVFDANGNLYGTPHNLVWVSHTHDKQRRNYRYQSAAYFFPANNTPPSVIALVTNQRVAVANSLGELTPANQETAGASVVVLNLLYAPTNDLDGKISLAQSQIGVYYMNGKNFDVAAATVDTAHTSPTGYVALRNPRYLKAYPQQTNPSQFNYLLADDNGVFDLVGVSIGATSALVAQWGFTQDDYQNLKTSSIPSYDVPLDAAGVPFPRGGGTNPLDNTLPLLPKIPFIPYSIQRTATDTVGAYPVGRYLITNGYSQGDVSRDPRLNPNDPTNVTTNLLAGSLHFGGEVLELSVGVSGATLVTQVTAAHTLSRPTNTSPLVQPTFAYRP